jgi:hypothetical protein
MEQLRDYDTFINYGLKGKAPEGFHKTGVHLIFDIKHDGRHKSRCIVNGHLTALPTESVYSGVVSLQGLRTLVFLAELNGMDTWATDIGNAYLEAETNKKVYIVAGPEFGEMEGHTLVVFKSLYVASVGMNALQIAFMRWVSIRQKLKKTFGCVIQKMASCGSISLYMSTTCVWYA